MKVFWLLVGSSWLCVSCSKSDSDSKDTSIPDSPIDSDTSDGALPTVQQFEIEGENCENPVSGIARFIESSANRGLTLPIPSIVSSNPNQNPPMGRGGSVIAQDFDADGDTDLLFHPLYEDPWLYLNDGIGNFERLEIEFPNHPGAYFGGITAAAATDLNGDFIPEILVVGPAYAGIYWTSSTGWGLAQTIHEDERPTRHRMQSTPFASYLSFTVGDLDGDGDLDVFLPGTGSIAEGNPNEAGGLDYVLLQDNTQFTLVQTLDAGEGGSRTMVALITDRDGDGDQDIFVPADGGPPSAFWRNDGPDGAGALALVNDAAEIYANLDMAAMGIDSADLNGDGLLDYCITDRARPRCLLSSSNGSYAESGQSIGVTVAEPASTQFTTTGWSIDFADLDNDGFLDIFQSSGPEGDADSQGIDGFPDLLWTGSASNQFTDVSLESGLGHTNDHYGHAIADFNRDGWLDLVVVGPETTPKLYMNQCGEAHWITVDLIGPAANTEAIGARLEANLEHRTDTREITNLRAQGQNPSLLHYGLGDSETVPSIRVIWPDGRIEIARNLAANTHYTFVHPDADLPPWLENQ